MATIYDFKAVASNGKEIDFRQFEGKVLLIVNTASKCGFTPQFEGLEAIYEKYRDRDGDQSGANESHKRGLVCIGFPCNQFKEQDPGSDSEIEQFCQVNYGVTFLITKKTDVNGPDEHPVFTWLKEQAPTEEYKGIKAKATHTLLKGLSTSAKKESDILWNFTKFLIGKDGVTVKRFAPTTEPKDFEQEIEAML